MKLPTLRPPPARLGAVAPVTDSAQEMYITRYGRGRGEPRWAAEQRDWETSARAYARFNGPAAFNALVISDMCARCDLRIEQRDESGDWPETEDPRLIRIMDEYKNRWQNTADLVRAHAWRYNVDGHGFMAFWDGETGVEYGMFSSTRVELNKPVHGQVTIKLIKEGRIDDGTAIVVPSEQVFHVWVPDNEELLRPTSPMVSSIEDLHRYRALTRYAWRTAESRLAMEGILWFPSELEREPGSPDDDVDLGESIGYAKSAFEEKYYELAKLSLENNDDIAAIAPPYMSWEKDLGAPEWVQVGRGLDDAGIAHRREAIEDAARPWPVPTTALMGGGVGDANHWSEWLASDKFVDSGVKPNMDRICHMDLTRVFLARRLAYEGFGPQDIINIRVGYDVGPIVIKKDNSETALKLAAIGGLGYEPLVEACGFEPGDLPTPEDRQLMIDFLSKATPPAPGAPGQPVAEGTGPGGPPKQPTAPPPQPPMALAASIDPDDAPTPIDVAAVLASVLSGASTNGHGG